MSVSKTCMTILITIFNVLIILMAIVLCFLSLCLWNDYATCTYTILIATFWLCCICFENNVAIGIYTILMLTDFLLLFSNAIYHTIITINYSQYCFNNDNDINLIPEWGCHDWRFNGYYERSVAVTVLYYFTSIFRLTNIIVGCLLSNKYYNDNEY